MRVPVPKNSGEKRRPVFPVPLLRRLAVRGLDVSPQDLMTFKPDAIDVLIARAFQGGHFNTEDIQAYAAQVSPSTELSASTIEQRLLEPVRFAWYTQRFLMAMNGLSSAVLAAVYRRALTGDLRAASVFLHYAQSVQPPAMPVPMTPAEAAAADAAAAAQSEEVVVDESELEALGLITGALEGGQAPPGITEAPGRVPAE